MTRIDNAWSKAELVLKYLMWISFFATIWVRDTGGRDWGELSATLYLFPRDTTSTKEIGFKNFPFLKESVLELDWAELNVKPYRNPGLCFCLPGPFPLGGSFVPDGHAIAEQRGGGRSWCIPTERTLNTALHPRCVAQFYPEPARARPAQCFHTNREGSPGWLADVHTLAFKSFSLGGFKNTDHGLWFPEDLKGKSLS